MSRSAPVFRRSVTPDGSLAFLSVGTLEQEGQDWCFRVNPLYVQDPLSLTFAPEGAAQVDPYLQKSTGRPPAMFTELALGGWALNALQSMSPQVQAMGLPPVEEWGWWERILFAPRECAGALCVGDPLAKPALEELILQAATGPWPARAELPKGVHLLPGVFTSGHEHVLVHIPDTDAEGVFEVWRFAHQPGGVSGLVAQATVLSLAHELGLQVPPHRLVKTPMGVALAVERFDRSAEAVQHVLNSATVLGVDRYPAPQEPRLSYVELSKLLATPQERLDLYMRVLLNAAVGYAKEGLQDLCLVQDSQGHWRLGPLFDIKPEFNRKGLPLFALSLTASGQKLASIPNLLAAARDIAGLPPAKAFTLIDKTFSLVQKRWLALFTQHSEGLEGVKAAAWEHVFVPQVPAQA